MGRIAWIGIFAAIVMAEAAWAAPATEAMIAETQAALDKGDARHAANLADAALKENISAGERGRLLLYRGLAEELLGSHDPGDARFHRRAWIPVRFRPRNARRPCCSVAFCATGSGVWTRRPRTIVPLSR